MCTLLTVPSLQAVPMASPVGKNLTELTSPSWPSNLITHCPERLSQIHAVRSLLWRSRDVRDKEKNDIMCFKIICQLQLVYIYVTRKTCTVPYFLWCIYVYLTYCSGKHSEWIFWIQSQPVCLEMCRQRCRRAKAKQTSQLYTPRTALYFQGKRGAAQGGQRTHHTLLSRRVL